MENLTEAWTMHRYLKRTALYAAMAPLERQRVIRRSYFDLLLAAAIDVLAAERADRPLLGELLVASGAVS